MPAFPLFHRSAIHKAIACGFLALFADFLFYRQHIGWTLGLFCFAGLIVAVFFTPKGGRMKSIVAVLTCGQCLALIEQPNSLSFLLVFVGIISTSIAHNARWHENARYWMRCIVRILLLIPARLFADNRLIGRIKSRHAITKEHFVFIRNWLLPGMCTLTFIWLLSEANPVIESWLANNWFAELYKWFNPFRLITMALIFAVSWTLLRAKFKLPPPKLETDYIRKGWLAWLFSPQAVWRSLMLFNALFAMQTFMDMLYLWGGAALPNGMTYAGYAQRGAYPLVVTALLSALFILIVFRRENEQNVSLQVRGLIYAWIAQNIVLVISSITRLALYIEQYSLTYLRVSALIWMGLVATGLLLILLRIYARKDNVWLINANTVTVLTTFQSMVDVYY